MDGVKRRNWLGKVTQSRRSSDKVDGEKGRNKVSLAVFGQNTGKLGGLGLIWNL